MTLIHKMLVGNYNPNFEEWEDIREATRAEQLLAVGQLEGVTSERRCIRHEASDYVPGACSDRCDHIRVFVVPVEVSA